MHLDLVGLVHHVGIGDDITVRRHNHARTEAVLAPFARNLELLVELVAEEMPEHRVVHERRGRMAALAFHDTRGGDIDHGRHGGPGHGRKPVGTAQRHRTQGWRARGRAHPPGTGAEQHTDQDATKKKNTGDYTDTEGTTIKRHAAGSFVVLQLNYPIEGPAGGKFNRRWIRNNARRANKENAPAQPALRAGRWAARRIRCPPRRPAG